MKSLAACPICESESWKRLYTGRTTRNECDPKRWQVAVCTQCQHCFLNPQPSWSDLGEYYHSGYQSYESTHGVGESLEKAVESARMSGSYRHVSIHSGLKVLDVGSGGGSFLCVAKALGAEVMGVEPSSHGVNSAKSLGLEVFEGTLEEFAAGKPHLRFDLITFSHVVEHLPDPIGTIALAATLLAAGGRIWVAIPNGACRFARLLEWRWHSTDLPLHLHHFSPNSLRVLADRADVSLLDLRTYSLPKSVRGSILSEWRYRWLVPRRIGSRLLSQRRVERRAARMDAEGSGEAILAEFGRRGNVVD